MTARKPASLSGTLLARKGAAAPAAAVESLIPVKKPAARDLRLPAAVVLLAATVAVVAVVASWQHMPARDQAVAVAQQPAKVAEAAKVTAVAEVAKVAEVTEAAKTAVAAPQKAPVEPAVEKAVKSPPPAPPAPVVASVPAVRAIPAVPVPKRKPKPKPVARARYVLQLSAVKTAAGARKETARLKRSLGPLLKGKRLRVRKAAVGGRAAVYRLHLVGFADRRGARQLCARIKARSMNCLIRKP